MIKIKEIIKPEQPIYWIIKDDDGNIVHAGIITQDQVVSTALPQLISYVKEIDQIKDIENSIGEKQPAFNYKYNESSRAWEFKDDSVIYLPVSITIASELNVALYKCIDPNGSGNYAVEIPHQMWENYVLYKLNKTDKIPIDLAVDPSPLQNALAIAVADSGITQEEADWIVSSVQANAGHVINIIDFIPASWQPYIIDEQQARQLRYI